MIMVCLSIYLGLPLWFLSSVFMVLNIQALYMFFLSFIFKYFFYFGSIANGNVSKFWFLTFHCLYIEIQWIFVSLPLTTLLDLFIGVHWGLLKGFHESTQMSPEKNQERCLFRGFKFPIVESHWVFFRNKRLEISSGTGFLLPWILSVSFLLNGI